MSHAFTFTPSSKNAKTGPISVTTTSNDTCPAECVFRGNGCYAEAGPLGMLWRALSATKAGDAFKSGVAMVQSYDFDGLLAQIRKIKKGSLWRHNQAGDLPGNGSSIDADALQAIAAANHGKRGFTYTHKPLTRENVAAIRAANDAGFTVNVSANSAKHATQIKKAMPDLPVVCVLPIEAESERVLVQDGVKILVCPATRPGSSITCADCGACQLLNRHFVVGFPAHGASKKHAAAIATA